MERNYDPINWYYDEITHVLCLAGPLTYDFMYAFEKDMIPIPISLVVLNSGGGTERGGIMIARLIKERGIPTFVPPGAVCKSNCVMVFSAGSERYASIESELSVHFVWRPHNPTNWEDEQIFSIEMIQLLLDRTRHQYFRMIRDNTGVALYEEYTDLIIQRGLISSSVLAGRIWTRPRYIGYSNIAFVNQAFWSLDIQDMVSRGLITQLVAPSSFQLQEAPVPN